ncbi:MAG TPA: SAM-dependent methyltransferase [Chryseosolibacter sp.]
MMTGKGKVFLVPTIIADNTQSLVIPQQSRNVLPGIRHFVVEEVRTARRFLSSLKIFESIESLHFSVLDKNTREDEIAAMLAPALEGNPMAILSESGCPGVADPGALAVNYCHRAGIKVVPLVGPSSLLLGLMASGLNGQKFAFHGYLPIEQRELSQAIKMLELESRKNAQSQIMIETPYRNNQVLKALLQTLSPQTELCVAQDITGIDELIVTKRVSQWRLQSIEMHKKPAVFIFLAH